jgi:GGDEF domain-containing protein
LSELDVRQLNEELETAYVTTLEGWAQALELRDKETEGHSRSVTELSIEQFNLSDSDDGLYRPISLSFGYAVVQEGGSLADCYKAADQAMYVNKGKKKAK